MKFGLTTYLIVGIALLGIYLLFFSSNQVIPNSGDVKVEAETPATAPAIPREADPLHTIGPFDPQFNTGIPPARGAQMNPVKQNTNVLPYPQISNNYGPQQANLNGQFGTDSGTQPQLDCFPKDTIKPQELMPRDDTYNTWQQTSPPVNGHLADRNFLEAGHHYGIDTVSNTLKNPNLQLRSDPIIPQVQVGPWSQSTYGPDTNHRQFDIGGDY
jgi:hypothetical protein|uniref:Minor capsid protein P11 C-terminal conserved region domain-containing protein n=1 Tax=viral metagenome TaxID=1070528 RepID=A0A6C0BLE7_9ZZZZ